MNINTLQISHGHGRLSPSFLGQFVMDSCIVRREVRRYKRQFGRVEQGEDQAVSEEEVIRLLLSSTLGQTSFAEVKSSPPPRARQVMVRFALNTHTHTYTTHTYTHAHTYYNIHTPYAYNTHTSSTFKICSH